MVERRVVAGAAIFTAFVAAATMMINASIPATTGYFNVGEIMVYTAALLMGPYVGAFAGGVGSMISDLSLGFPQFAPGTLVIKAGEGFIVGYLGNLALKGFTVTNWRVISLLLGVVTAFLVASVGSTFYSGDFQLAIGAPPYTPQANITFSVPPLFWVGLAVAVFAGIVLVGVRIEQRVGWLALSILIGGSEMVIGYFLYETLILGNTAASVEIPFNVMQAVVGLIVALPLVRSVQRIMSHREEQLVSSSSLELGSVDHPNRQS
ncbi:MAG: ECF transporter S component [Thaumarchaeota archaeon]|nr:ECF transporter S component [Nitrososphaerota archaeon]